MFQIRLTARSATLVVSISDSMSFHRFKSNDCKVLLVTLGYRLSQAGCWLSCSRTDTNLGAHDLIKRGMRFSSVWERLACLSPVRCMTQQHCPAILTISWSSWSPPGAVLSLAGIQSLYFLLPSISSMSLLVMMWLYTDERLYITTASNPIISSGKYTLFEMRLICVKKSIHNFVARFKDGYHCDRLRAAAMLSYPAIRSVVLCCDTLWLLPSIWWG